MLLWWGNGKHFCKLHDAKKQKCSNSITFKGTNSRLENACAPNHRNQYGLAHTHFFKNSGQDVAVKNVSLARKKHRQLRIQAKTIRPVIKIELLDVNFKHLETSKGRRLTGRNCAGA